MKKSHAFVERFKQFVAKHSLVNEGKTTLLAVSGGVDSVVLCRLFAEAGFPFAIAHCNFQLRGADSEGDEQFVKELGAQYKVQVYTKRFDTATYAEARKLSIQVSARELRYEWFNEVCKEKNFRRIATAHHLNDNLETVLYKLVKGTGIRGLRGIPIKQGNVIRPLLFATREEVESYLQEQKLLFRQDDSNLEDKYARNKIRLNVVPALKEINPGLEHTLGGKIELFGELEELYLKEVRRKEKQLFLPRRGDFYIPIAKLRKTPHAQSALFEFLHPFEFTASQVEDILQAIDAPAGKQFISPKARVIKDRRFFILTQQKSTDKTIHIIEEGDDEAAIGEHVLQLATKDARELKLNGSKTNAFIDKHKLKFPLTLRIWKQGDYFYPFGMKMKKKKLKKFLIDEKVPLNEKEKIWVLESEGKVVWVVGHRLDERFKVTDKTQEVFCLKVKG